MTSFNSDPYTTPAMEAPSGFHSNLINPPSTNYSTIIICVLVIVLSTPFVIARLYTRKFITHQVWWDDCTYSILSHSVWAVYWQTVTGSCLLGWLFEIALTGLLFKAIHYGGGTDLWNVSEADYTHFTKVSTWSLSNHWANHSTVVISRPTRWKPDIQSFRFSMMSKSSLESECSLQKPLLSSFITAFSSRPGRDLPISGGGKDNVQAPALSQTSRNLWMVARASPFPSAQVQCNVGAAFS